MAPRGSLAAALTRPFRTTRDHHSSGSNVSKIFSNFLFFTSCPSPSLPGYSVSRNLLTGMVNESLMKIIRPCFISSPSPPSPSPFSPSPSSHSPFSSSPFSLSPFSSSSYSSSSSDASAAMDSELRRWQRPIDHGVPKYSGLTTLLRAPLATTISQLDIALVGVPFDGGASHPGTRLGPREIRNKSSMLRKIHGSTGISPFSLCQIADVGDVIISHPWSGVESALKEIENFYTPLCEEGVVPLSAGGDHSITLPILRALAKKYGPIGMVHLDAHMDTSDTTESENSMGSKYWNGTPFSNAVEEGVLDPKKTIQIGIRGPVSSAKMRSLEWGMRVVPMEEFYDLGPRKVAQIAREVVGNGPTYITFDVDALDPAFAIGTGSPEDGGLTTLEAQLLLRGLRGLNLIGADFVCTSPLWDPTGSTPRVAANMMFELLCLLAESRAQTKKV